MSEKRMLILPVELAQKIDNNRGDLSQAEFIDFLIESHLKEAKEPKYVTKEEIESLKQAVKKILVKEEGGDKKYVTREEVQVFREDTRKLLKSFLDFFIGYGLELGKASPKNELDELASKLQGLEDDLTSEEGREVKIKWK